MDQNQEQVVDQDLDFISKQEAQRREAARKIFINDGNPEPERRKVDFWDIVSIFGLEVVLRVLSTIGAALVSATAVGVVMEISESLLKKAFDAQIDTGGSGIFYWSMLAFEGGLMAAGMTKGRKAGAIKDSNWALWAGFGVTVTAGLMRSFTLIENELLTMALALVFGLIVAAAGPVISYFGTENLGHILEEIRRQQGILDEQWKAELKEWAERFKHEYPRIARQVFGEDRRLKVKYEDQDTQKKSKEPEAPGKNIRAMIKAYLKEQGILPTQVGELNKGGIITPAQIADGLGLVGKERDAVRTYMSQFRGEEKIRKW